MLKDEKQGKIISMNYESRTDYYTTPGKKVGDFLMGFFGFLALSFVGSILGSIISSFGSNGFISSIFGIFLLFVALGLCIFFFKIKRRFIAIGIISITLIPVLLFGSCLLLLSPWNR